MSRRLPRQSALATSGRCEEPGGAIGALLKLRRERGEQLEPRCGELTAEAQLRGRPDEERLCFGGVEPRQLRAIAVLEPIAARRPPHGHDGHTRVGERKRVSLNRPLGYVEALRELRCRHLSSRLQDEEERHETRRAHGWSVFHKGDTG